MDQWEQTKNEARRVAAWIGDKPCFADGVAVRGAQLRKTVRPPRRNPVRRARVNETSRFVSD